MAETPDLSIVVPFYDEQDNVRAVTDGLIATLDHEKTKFEIVLVNNGSRDGTGGEIDKVAMAHPDVVVKVKVPVNRGFGYGVAAGLKACKGRFVGYMVGDLQSDPKDAFRIYYVVAHNSSSIAKGYRVVRRDPVHRRLLSRMYNCLFRALYGINVRDVNGTPKVFDSRYIERLDLLSRQSFLDSELLVKLHRLGCRVIEVPVKGLERPTGSSKVKLLVVLDLFCSLIFFRLVGYRSWSKHIQCRTRS